MIGRHHNLCRIRYSGSSQRLFIFLGVTNTVYRVPIRYRSKTWRRHRDRVIRRSRIHTSVTQLQPRVHDYFERIESLIIIIMCLDSLSYTLSNSITINIRGAIPSNPSCASSLISGHFRRILHLYSMDNPFVTSPYCASSISQI